MTATLTGFPKDFLWGASTSDYQVEGASDEDGKGPGIWDALSAGHVRHGESGTQGSDEYHRLDEDIALMKKIGLTAYRFSVSWPRVMPEEGVINEKGLDYYSRLVDKLLAAGIKPVVTLYHWNMPMWVHQKGGWHDPGIVRLFGDFAATVVDRLSDRVDTWLTVNEPTTFIGNGYVTGTHAPFENILGEPAEKMGAVIALLTRNVLLAHGAAVDAIRAHSVLRPRIGAALNGSVFVPLDEDPLRPGSATDDDITAAKIRTFPDNPTFSAMAWWADPMILGTVPAPLRTVLSDDDLTAIHRPLDFFAFNCYNSSDFDEYMGPNPNVRPGMPRTAMGWPVTPNALYWGARFFYERYRLPIMVTENGMANVDFVDPSDGAVHDPQRILYMREYLSGLQKACEEGIPVIGYFAWSLLDNFEWADGYDPRFGLIYVDYRTMRRIPKDSALWYSSLIAANRG